MRAVMRGDRTGSGFVWILVVGFFSVLCSPVMAQWGGMGMGGDAMQMAIGRESVDRYADILGFDAVQRDTAHMLHQEYLDKFKQANDTFTDAMRRLQEDVGQSGDWQKMMKPMGRIALGFMDRLDGLEKAFFDDLKMLAIEPEQEEAFVRVERARRREEAAVMGQISVVSGATLDLHEVAREVEVSGNEAAREALLAYEAEIDGVNTRLIDRAMGFMRGQMERMRDMAEDDQTMGFNAEAMEKMQASMAEMRELGTQGKAINARYARQIMQSLPVERRAKWDQEVKRRTWPTVYRDSKALRQIEAASKLEDLTAGQRESLDAVRQSYEREAAPMNERWAKAIDDQQARDDGNFWGWGGDTSATDEVQKERSALDARFVERVRSLLTPEQIKRMPAAGDSGFDAEEVLRQFGGG